jgi:hypothetical protein
MSTTLKVSFQHSEQSVDLSEYQSSQHRSRASTPVHPLSPPLY